MKLTLGQAAKHARRAKGTLSNALKNGSLSGDKIVKNGRDTWQIEAAELQRWIDSNPIQNDKEVQNTTPENYDKIDIKTNTLQAKLDAAEQRYNDLEKSSAEAAATAARTIEDLRERLDREAEERRQATAMLTDSRASRGFWARLTGR